MNATWLHRAGHPRVLVFFAGWGMDDAPFRRLTASRWDVLVYFDFRFPDDVPFRTEIEAYAEKSLLAWSLGCAVANRAAMACGWTFQRALAINGTLIPEDDHAGIPARWMTATAQHLTTGGWEKFVGRMCPDEASRSAFDAARPNRDLCGAVEELQILRRLPPPAACIFDTALVSETDRVLLPENQLACWARYGVPVHRLRAPHDPFHLWSSWEEALACAG